MASIPSDKPNIRQVASIAGVSHMTVSRVLNDHPNIKPETRRRVLEAIEELDYRPNLAARALATQRTGRIGVIVESAVAFAPSSVLRAVERAARAAGYSITSVALHDDDPLTPQDAVDNLTAQGVDALCVVAPRSSSVAALRKIAITVPLLVVKADSDPTFLTVSVDQQAGASLVVDHLVALGHRDILHVAGPLDWLDARARERAFHARAKSWGIRERPIVVGDWTADFAYDFAMGLTRLPEYTAIFAANDDTAIGLIHGLHDRGFDVPGDLSVVGFDDVPLSRHFLPPLTTVRQDFHALGQAVVEMLHAAMEEREIPHLTRIPTELVVRGSTASPRGAR
ncbi:LacI family DNA-binding transcriptional regulator [Microbacterium stercoris]|uniref:LacI family DNA-binding transcriptional regulator n=1 Tax=Microbacterium stercoris TaxID=2820289 RepID=A0A939QI89_9MICO|nr:LacI family DNA-binding transcriptional regulator [Microbacterium stercoris]MBO3662157.1 LacI family DNA-binding transcriptional regulator [Microbacterium stercoris]